MLDPSGELHRVTGDGVRALELIRGGVEPRDVPDDLAGAVDDLVAAGVVAESSGWSRRRMLVASGSTLAAATVVSFALADPAAAESGCPQVTPTDPAAEGVVYDVAGTSQYVTRLGQSSVLVRAWGAGGGGGEGRYTSGGWYPGGGGGLGAYASSTLDVAACETYTVTVGTGGTATTGDGGTGGQSFFQSTSTLMAAGGSGGSQGVGGCPRSC